MTRKSIDRRNYALGVANGAKPVRKGEYYRALLAVGIALVFITTGAVKLPLNSATFAKSPLPRSLDPHLAPIVVKASTNVPAAVRLLPKVAKSLATVPVEPSVSSFMPEARAFVRATAHEAIKMKRGLLPHVPAKFARALEGEEIPISITQYCVRGETRRGRRVRPGIVAADPRIFPLSRYVEVFLGDKYLGRYLVDDTGGNVLGATLDMWTPSCPEAVRFGRHVGKAVLVASSDEHGPLPATPARLEELAKR